METITIILAVLAPLCTIAAFVFARTDATRKRGQDNGELLAKVNHTLDTVNDIRTEQRELKADVKKDQSEIKCKLDDVSGRLVAVEKDVVTVTRDVKLAHDRISEIKKTAGKTAKE